MDYTKCELGYVLKLEIGEELQETLRQFAEKLSISGGFYQGIGAIHQVELAFFCREEKTYKKECFDQDYELISMMGNISSHDGTFLPHTHVTLGDQNFHTISGHLVRGTVSVTAEILLITTKLLLERKEDPTLEFQALSLPDKQRLHID